MLYRLILAVLLAAGIVAPTVRSQDAPPTPIVVSAPAGHAVPLGRLGEAVTPQAYRLDLTIDPSQPRFSGKVEIDIALDAPADMIDLHGRGLNVTVVHARIDGGMVAGQWRQTSPAGGARISFAEPIPAGKATLVFAYDAAFADGPVGMFRVNVDGEWYSWTQFQSIDARAAFPSFDQPGFKTPFTVTVRTAPNLMAISNAPESGAPQIVDGLAVHRFDPTSPLPTYLLAVMVGPFVTLEGAVPPGPQRAEPLPLRIISTRPNAGRLSFALEGTKEIVTLLEDYFGERFPYPKLDQITSPILPGAMENPGADLYRDDILVMDESAPVVQQREFARVVAHELGHQWFGDLVTPAWWDDIWLNESFANWLGYRIGDAWRPELGLAGDALAESYRAMATDALLAGRPIREPIRTSDQVDAAFDSITYGKGGQVVAMVAAWMGEERFREGVRRYIAAHRHASATSEDFFAALAEVAADPRLVPAMRSFVDRQGVPLLAMRVEGDQVLVTQMRYTTAGIAPPPAHWVIPLCLRRVANRQCFLMDQQSQAFTLGGEGPVFPNAGGAGYYRFELTARHWKELIASAGELPAGEAMALVDSLDASIRAGRGTIGEMGNLARELIRHPDPHAADAADDALGRLVAEGIVHASGRRAFRRFRERLYMPLLKDYGFDPRAGVYADEAPSRTQRRVQIVSALIGTGRGGKIRKQLSLASKAYLAGDKSALDQAWLDRALDYYLFEEGSDATRALVERALSSEDPVFRPAALAAASRTGRKDTAEWLLSLDDPRLRESEKADFLDGVMARTATRDFGYDWALQHFDELLAASDGQFFSRRLPQMLGRFCSVERAEQIERDFKPRFAGTPGALELDRAIERVRNCGLLDDLLGNQIEEEFLKLP